ncbi:MAG TPA: hypothetical protein VMD91_11645 [Candidatus Sulfotelmatobacter sp.]|nr:hypothetical protein [Candidatus Sulfotelmatobacter sp.]
MRPSPAAVRAIFVLATAISAAALVDPVLESLSNAGLFGPHSYTDHSTLDVLPSLVVGAGCLALLIAILVRRIFVPSGRSLPWLRVPAQALDDRTVLRLAPLIVALELGVLCTMETLEQLVVSGHVMGGTIWLGGPVAVSLAAHASFAFALGFVFARLTRWSARAAAELIAYVCGLVLARGAHAPTHLARARVPLRRAFAPAFDRRTGRAPPYRTS